MSSFPKKYEPKIKSYELPQRCVPCDATHAYEVTENVLSVISVTYSCIQTHLNYSDKLKSNYVLWQQEARKKRCI